MKRDSTSISISKIYIFLGIVSVTGIFFLFSLIKSKPEVTSQHLNSDYINQVLQATRPIIYSAWVNPSQYISKNDCDLPTNVGVAFLECNPMGWQCLWKNHEYILIEYQGKKYKLKASKEIDFVYRKVQGINNRSGYITEIEIPELNIKQKIFLAKTCHEMYLPERTYAYGEVEDPRDQGILWDNAGRKIFIDKFYVSEGDVQEWRKYIGVDFSTETPWKPAKLSMIDQKQYCSFHGKNRLMAHFFDASQMTPQDMRMKYPDMIVRPDTPWQRDYNRTFFAKAKNENFKLSKRDCSLAQVLGCEENYFMTDSLSWSGVAFGLGFEEESFYNPFEENLNVKKSSRLQAATSLWHKLGRRSESKENVSYAFRCYREIL